MSLRLDSSEKITLQKLQKQVKERWQYVRITSILMLSDGFSVSEISSILGIDDNSIYRYQSAYLDLELDSFLSRDYQGYFGKLDSIQLEALNQELRDTLYRSSQAVCDYVHQEFDITYSESGMCALLHRLGYSYKKTKSVPLKADKAKQESFLAQLEELLAEEEVVIYGTSYS